MKILIADDEYYTVQMICSQMDWSLLGIESVLTAYNGEEALQVFRAEMPELVLCDMDMPRMDGLEVLRQVAALAPETKFIFLTCYDKFEYAQKAIRLGAVDYLCKPLSMPELYAVVMREATAVNEGRRQRKYGELGLHWERHQKKIDQNLISDLLYQKIPARKDAVEQALSREPHAFRSDQRYRMVLSCMSQNHPVPGQEMEGTCQFVFWNMLADIFYGDVDNMEGLPVCWNGVYGILLIMDGEVSLDEIVKSVYQLSDMTELHLKSVFSCCVSEPVYLWEFALQLENLKKLLEKQFLNSVKFGRCPLVQDEDSGERGHVDVRYLCDCLAQQDLKGIMDYLRNLLGKLQQDACLTTEMIRGIHADITQAIYSFCYDYGIAAHELYQGEEIARLRQRAEQLPYYLIRSVELVCTQIVELRRLQAEEHALCQQIDEYIREHYREPIGRDELAALLHYSQNYLSKIFRTQMGMSFRDCVNHYRIEEAKRLLTGTSRNIGDIALEIGFESMAYFSTVFKKHCGMTPAQWRSGKG